MSGGDTSVGVADSIGCGEAVGDAVGVCDGSSVLDGLGVGDSVGSEVLEAGAVGVPRRAAIGAESATQASPRSAILTRTNALVIMTFGCRRPGSSSLCLIRRVRCRGRTSIVQLPQCWDEARAHRGCQVHRAQPDHQNANAERLSEYAAQ
jgi:hypothetical protein